jgi:SAM-dependent methyltransferase
MDYRDLQAGQTKDRFWFKAKNDLISILMEKACKEKRDLKILNIGVGTGEDLEILNKFGKNYIIDIDKNALSLIDNRLCQEKIIANASNLPYQDDFFDVAVSFDVFEHIKDQQKAVRECYRVLKENGALVFSVPAFNFLYSSHDRALNHHRRYDRGNLKNLLSDFSNLKTFFWNSLLFTPIAFKRLFEKKARPKVDHFNFFGWVDALFYRILSVDNFFIKKNGSLPFGLTIVGFCYKINKNN